VTREDKALQARFGTHARALKAEEIMVTLAEHASVRNARSVIRMALDATRDADDIMDEAQATLRSDSLEGYRRFWQESLGHMYRDLLWMQQIGAEGVIRILKASPLWDALPPEEKGLVQRGWEALFGGRDPWE